MNSDKVRELIESGKIDCPFCGPINAGYKDSEKKIRTVISDWRKEAERLKKRKIFNGQRSVYVQCANQLETLLLNLALDKAETKFRP